jgi:hypothetical protein
MLARNAVMASSLAPVAFGHHVHLLLDDGGASGGHSDDKRDHPQVRRTRQHPQRLGAAHPALLLQQRLPAHLVLPENQDDNAGAERQRRGADQQQVDAADFVHQVFREAGTERAAQDSRRRR